MEKPPLKLSNPSFHYLIFKVQLLLIILISENPYWILIYIKIINWLWYRFVLSCVIVTSTLAAYYFLVAIAPLQMLDGHMSHVDNADIANFHHCGKFCWTALVIETWIIFLSVFFKNHFNKVVPSAKWIIWKHMSLYFLFYPKNIFENNLLK